MATKFFEIPSFSIIFMYYQMVTKLKPKYNVFGNLLFRGGGGGGGGGSTLRVKTQDQISMV